jgi:hypothetical protein
MTRIVRPTKYVTAFGHVIPHRAEAGEALQRWKTLSHHTLFAAALRDRNPVIHRDRRLNLSPGEADFAKRVEL